MKVDVSFAKILLAPVATMTCSSAIDGAIKSKTRVKGAIVTNRAGVVRARKWKTLIIPNEHMNDIIRTIKSLKNSAVLIDGVSEAVRLEIKNSRVDFLVWC